MTSQKDNSGALFKSNRKEKDSDADYSGSVIISGKEFWVNGWKNTSPRGKDYVSLRFKPKTISATKEVIKQSAISDEIPF